MLNIRIVLSLLLSVAFFPGTLAAQYDRRDSGEYLSWGRSTERTGGTWTSLTGLNSLRGKTAPS